MIGAGDVAIELLLASRAARRRAGLARIVEHRDRVYRVQPRACGLFSFASAQKMGLDRRPESGYIM